MTGRPNESYRSGGHSIIEIDLSALRHNLQAVRRAAGEAAIMAVVKADAYGHGLERIAGALEGEVEGFAVNDVSEGVALRRAGIRAPVLVFGVPEPQHRGACARWNLTATVSSLRHIDMLEEGASCHLNFDTGMGRLGMDPAEAEAAVRALEAHPGVACSGVYSHFATADTPGSPMAERQLKRFRELLGTLEEPLRQAWERRGGETPFRVHLANSGGLFFYPESRFNMVRTGIALYGYAPGDTPAGTLRPVLGWKSRLVQVHPVRKGESVSYGARWTAPEDGYIGVMPVGYEDGIRRNLSGKISVEIGSNRYEVAGTVTMNYCMVWLGQDRWPEITEVSILNDRLDAASWAKASGTIPYEILTGLLRGIPRRSVGY